MVNKETELKRKIRSLSGIAKDFNELLFFLRTKYPRVYNKFVKYHLDKEIKRCGLINKGDLK